ncbi:MAG TPA: response regulator transcription factor [Anaerolineae bacterium]|nr:response regulator transcription factor [Anaerolineae bacterium]
MSDEQSKIRLVIVEDHAVVRSGLRRLLEELPDVEVVMDTELGEEAVRIVEEQAPDVVLLDLVLDNSQLDGLETLKRITTSSPSTHVVVLSAYAEESLVLPALRSGATGYVLKRALPAEVIEAIRDAAKGQLHLDAPIARKVVEYLRLETNANEEHRVEDRLTQREKEILPLLMKGLTNQQIAVQLVIAPATVKTHVSNILHKLGASHRTKIGLIIAQQQTRPPALNS